MGPIGHLGIGFAAKPVSPKAPLWVLLVASEVLDILSFVFVAIGFEEVSMNLSEFIQGNTVISVPWSHGLGMSVLWSLLATTITFLIYRDRRTASIIGLVVFSHWVLDFIVHTPDLPLFFSGSPLVGLGLWKTNTGLIFSFILEIVLMVGGVALYLKARNRINDLAK
ncbi:MAG: hypothetical protein ISR58_12475 [Anaerolineales bacterium]|nr:hypothetical protein [Chloroflexota bacterium]MBL6981994.1 hypothetical protein [Anaerolineales bacterium]